MQDLTCACCGRPMYRAKGSLPQGQATCHPCRAILRENANVQRRRPRTASPQSRGQRTFSELRQCKQCGEMFEAHRSDQLYCRVACRESRRGWKASTRVASPDERGYGKEHRMVRARWKQTIDAQGGIDCCLCGGWIEASEVWHLDHTPNRDGYRGVAHPLCNVRDGASRGARRSNQGRSYAKDCATCGQGFNTTYPKQAYCSKQCRPKPQPKPKTPPPARNCLDCGRTIKRGKRCDPCAKTYARTVARNNYRAQVGIPLDAPKYDRSWRAA